MSLLREVRNLARQVERETEVLPLYTFWRGLGEDDRWRGIDLSDDKLEVWIYSEDRQERIELAPEEEQRKPRDTKGSKNSP